MKHKQFYKRHPILWRFRRAAKRLAKRFGRQHERLVKRSLALRHHRLWGEPRSVEHTLARTTKLPYPQFIIIGAPKCGTSWLQGALSQHPNIIVVPNEIEYFSSNLERYPLEWYSDHFRQRVAAVSSGKRQPYFLGEKSARYCSLSPEIIRIVHHLLPDVRLILMTRSPVARHWAHAKRYFAKKRVTKREGGDVLTVPRERLFEFLDETRGLGQFPTIIDNWTSVYPADQLLIVSQERTLADPHSTFTAVLEHIGLPADYDPMLISLLSEQKNRGPRVEMPDDVARHLEGLFAGECQYLRDLFRENGFVRADKHTAIGSSAASLSTSQ